MIEEVFSLFFEGYRKRNFFDKILDLFGFELTKKVRVTTRQYLKYRILRWLQENLEVSSIKSIARIDNRLDSIERRLNERNTKYENTVLEDMKKTLENMKTDMARFDSKFNERYRLLVERLTGVECGIVKRYKK